MPPTAPQDRRRKATSKTSPAAEPVYGTPQQPVQDPESKYAATTWGSDNGGAQDLTTPSGQLCLVRKPGIEALIKTGVLNDIDSLTSIVEKNHLTPGGKAQKVDGRSLLKDVAAIENLMHTVDRVVTNVVVKPEVRMTPNDPTSRVPGVVYCDMIELEDKMFIFQFAVGGTKDLERFRQQSQAAMGAVDFGENVPLPSE